MTMPDATVEYSAVAPKEPIGIGLIGLGYWGPNHLRVVSESPRTEIKAICDTDPDRLELMDGRTDAVAFANPEELLELSEVDAVIVATPVGTHFALGTAALEAGKHVLIEKPLAPTVGEADHLISLAKSKGLSVMCGHTFLFSPPVIEVKRMIDEGELGEIYFITSSRVNLGLHQKDVSVLWDLAPHDFSILGYWLGERPESLSANGRDSILQGVPDVAFVNLNYESGLIASVELSWLAPSKLRRTTIVGSEKMVVYEDNSPDQLRVFDKGISVEPPESFGEFHLSYRSGGIYTPKLSVAEPMATQLDAFVNSITTDERHPEHIGLARDVVAMIETAESSLDADGARMSVATHANFA